MNAFKTWLNSLAQSGGDPVGTAMNAYNMALKRKQSLIQNQLTERSLKAREGELGLGTRIQGLKERTADPSYVSDIAERKEVPKRRTNAEKDAGFFAYGATTEPVDAGMKEIQLDGPPALGDEPMTEVYPTQVVPDLKEPSGQDIANRFAAANAGKRMLSVREQQMKQKNKAEIDVDKAQQMMDRGLHPSINLFNRRLDEMPLDRRIGLEQRQVDLESTQAFPGAPKERPAEGIKRTRGLLDKKPPGTTVQQPMGMEPQQQYMLGEPINIMTFQRMMNDPVQRSTFFRMATPLDIRHAEPWLKKMINSYQLTEEERAILKQKAP